MSTDDYEIVLEVIPVRQRIGDFLIAAIPAKYLVEISYVDVRRLVSEQRDVEKYLGIQRPISTRRVNQIKKYLEGGDATFPTAIILSVNEDCATLDESDWRLTLKAFDPDPGEGEESVPFGRIAQVVDGQHRIAAFMDENHNYSYSFDGDFDLNVAIFVGADISKLATIFATVNLQQTKVSRSLAYDLTSLAKSPSPQKSCHNVAVALDRESSSPLHQRIKRLGVKTPGRLNKEPLTQAAFVESLIRFISKDPVEDRNQLLAGRKLKKPTIEELEKCPFRGLFIAGKDVEIAEIIYNYFCAVRRKWPKSWDDTETKGNLLPKSNTFKALMKFLLEDVYNDIVGYENEYGYIPSVDEFYKYFNGLKLRDSDFTTQNFVPGSGGQSMLLKMLRGEVSREEMLERD